MLGLPFSKFPITISRMEKFYGALKFLRTANRLLIPERAIILLWSVQLHNPNQKGGDWMGRTKTNTVTGGVLAENQAKIDNYEKSIKAALDRKRKVIMESKLYIYGQLSELFGGMEGQKLLDAVIKEHTLIGKLTASGMTYDQIAELADDSSADADNSTDESYSEKYGKQMSFSETDHSYSE